MSNKPTHNILLAKEYEAGDGEHKAFFTNIRSAWQRDSGAISCEICEGLAVSGRFVTLPKKAKDEAYGSCRLGCFVLQDNLAMNQEWRATQRMTMATSPTQLSTTAASDS